MLYLLQCLVKLSVIKASLVSSLLSILGAHTTSALRGTQTMGSPGVLPRWMLLGLLWTMPWGDCLEGCHGTSKLEGFLVKIFNYHSLECDDKYFSIQEGKCIYVSVPGAIPNWFGAPAVKLLDSTTGLVPAKTCKNKGAAVRLYDNTCRCVRGETAVDLDLRGTPRGNCTG